LDDDDDLSSISGDEGDRSVTTKQTASSTAAGTTSTAKKPRKKPKKHSPILDDEGISALASASQTSQAKMKELIRHNKFLEKLEAKKYRLEEAKQERENAKGKIDELEYKMKLVEKYKELKETHRWSDERIVQFFPDMKAVVETANT
jgi:hypothetical protein